jgi:hypothetical protein
MGFEPTISVLERAKTVRALDRSATAIGYGGDYEECLAPCGFIINRRFGGMCHLNFQGRRNNADEELRLTLFLPRAISSTVMIEATRSSETPVYNKPTLHHIPAYPKCHISIYFFKNLRTSSSFQD